MIIYNNYVFFVFFKLFWNDDVIWWVYLNRKNYRFKKFMRRSYLSCRYLYCEKGYNK